MKGLIRICIAFMFLTFNVLNAQNHQLTWYDNYASNNTEIIKKAGFNNAEYLDTEIGLPYFVKTVKLSLNQKINVQLSNIETQKSTYPLKDNQKSAISNNFEIEVNYGIGRNEKFANISFIPLRKNNFSEVEKLIQFDLEIAYETDFTQRRLTDRTYALNSKLSTGTWFKIETEEEGVYEINDSFLEDNSISTSDIRLDEVKLYGYPNGVLPELNALENFDDLVENPIKIIDNNNNNSFDAGDKILFYAANVDVLHFKESYLDWNYASEVKEWEYDGSGYFFDKNIYSPVKNYFIRFDGEKGKRVQVQNNPVVNAEYNTNAYDYVYVHEEEKQNEQHSGRIWMGERFEFTNAYTYPINIPHLDSSVPIDIFSSVGVTDCNDQSEFFNVSVNNQTVQNIQVNATINCSSGSSYLFEYMHSRAQKNSFNAPSNNFNLTYEHIKNSNESIGYLDKFILLARANLDFTNASEQNIFRDKNSINVNTSYNFQNLNNTTVWDISDVSAIEEMQISNNSFKALASENLKTYLAFGNNSFLSPLKIESVANQNLHAQDQEMKTKCQNIY